MSKVYVVTRPRENKFGWTPDLTDATRYGSLEVVFEPTKDHSFYLVLQYKRLDE